MTRRHAPRGGALMATLAVASLAIGAPAGASPGAPSGGPGSGSAAAADPSVAATEAQLAAIEAQIARQQEQVATFSEQFDQSTVHLQQVQAQLAQTNARLVVVTHRYRTARHELRADAVDAYIYDGAASQVSSVFSSASDTGALHTEYQDTAIANVTAAVNAARSAERQLLGTKARLRGEEQQAGSETAAVRHSEQAAQEETAAAESALSQVKGQLAQAIARQAALQAAQQAAAAANAATEAQRRRAAQQAAEDAQVAQTVGGDAAVTAAATNSANQAAGDAGQTGVVGVPGPATGAGAVALAAAERFLGVPYEYGGDTTAGLDCSGLTMLAWEEAGVSLVHSAALQRHESAPVPLDQIQPGDLLFYDLGGGGIDHVVMYVGSGPYGADTIIQAAHTGTVVRYDPIWYYGLVGAGQP